MLTTRASPHEWLLLGMANGTNGALIRPDGYKLLVGQQDYPFWWGPNFPNQVSVLSINLTLLLDSSFTLFLHEYYLLNISANSIYSELFNILIVIRITLSDHSFIPLFRLWLVLDPRFITPIILQLSPLALLDASMDFACTMCSPIPPNTMTSLQPCPSL